MGYKLLGFAVWRGAWWFLRRRYATHLKLAAGLAVIAGVAGMAVKGRAE
ncbi:MAG: hypothetical protein M3370_04570 [Actinomycetota bacterium]|nr:hypothetical protein [Actinomycetota bacterium]